MVADRVAGGEPIPEEAAQMGEELVSGHLALAIFLTRSCAIGRLTLQVGSSTRHCASVSPQPQVQCSEFSAASTLARLSAGRAARSTPGILLACAALATRALSSSSALTISRSGSVPARALVSSSVSDAFN